MMQYVAIISYLACVTMRYNIIDVEPCVFQQIFGDEDEEGSIQEA